MALTTEQKVDLLLKKIGYTKTKTGSVFGTGSVSGTGKQPFGEAIPSPLIIADSSLWNESESIPATPPASDTNQVKRYPTTSAIRMTLDTTVTPNRSFIAYATYNNTSSARLTNWIDTQFGPDYQLEVYVDDATDSNNKLPEGGSGSNDGWYFDYSAGVLNFSDTNIPSGVNGAGTNVYIVGYRYIGQTGAPTSGISTFSYLDLTVERNLDVGKQGGISTFHNNIDANGDLDVDGHTNLDNVSVAGVTTFSDRVRVLDDNYFELGNGADLKLIHQDFSGNAQLVNSSIINNRGYFRIANFGNAANTGHANANSMFIDAHTHQFRDQQAHLKAKFIENSAVELYHDGNLKFSTASSGINVVGTTTTGQLAVTGVSTFTGNIDANGDLDVDGHTNLDNVSVAGVTTFSNTVHIGTGTTIESNGQATFTGITTFSDGVRIPNFYPGSIRGKIQIGDSNGYEIFHYNNNNYLTFTRDLLIRGDNIGRQIRIQPKISQNGILVKPDAEVELYYNGSQKLETTNTGIDVTGDANFSGNVSIGGTLTYEDVVNVDAVGLITARSGIRVTGGVIEALAGENKIPSLYSAMNNLPSAGSYHGMFAHVHATGRGYFAHAGNWLELVNKEINGVVGTGTERYNIGPVDLTTLDVSGISTFAGNVDINADLDVSGISTFAGNVDINADIDVDGHTNLDNVNIVGVATVTGEINIPDKSGNSNWITFGDGEDLKIWHSGTSGHLNNITGDLYIQGAPGNNYVYIAPAGGAAALARFDMSGAGVRLYSNGNLKLMTRADGVRTYGTLEAANLNVTGVTTAVTVDVNGDLDVDGHTNLDNVSIAGVTTAAGTLRVGTGHTFHDNGNAQIAGIATFYNQIHIPRYYGSGVPTGQYLEIGADEMVMYQRWNGSVSNIEFRKHSGFFGHTSSASGKTLTIQSGAYTQFKYIQSNGGSGTYATFDKSASGTGSVGYVQLYGGSSKVLTTHTNLVKILNDLDVDGHTELDNVNIVGVTTTAGHILPATDSTYDLGSLSKQWRNFYVSNIVSAPGFGIIGPDLTVRNFTATGISTHVGIATFNNATFHRDIDVDGHTNLDNVSIAGVTTFADDVKAVFGNGGDLEIYHESSSHKSIIKESGASGFHFQGSNIVFDNTAGNKRYLNMVDGGAVELYFNSAPGGAAKLATTSGGINVTGLTDTDTLATGNATFTGTITAGGATGNNGQYLKSTGSGVAWDSFPSLRTRQTFTASSGQTTFNFAYTAGFLDVYVNGIKLTDSEFTATNGTSTVLAVGCFVGDIVELVAYNTVSAGGGAFGIGNVVEDLTPQLGGNLDLFNKTVEGTGSVNMTGVVTATKFVGDGSGLTGVTASGSGVIVKNSGTLVGTAQTIDFGSNLSVSPIVAGIVTITGSAGSSGISNIVEDTSPQLGGTLLVNDKNIKFGDSTGTANNRARFGASNDLEIYHQNSDGNNIIDSNTTDLHIKHGNEHMIKAIADGAVELYHDNVKKLETYSGGVSISGSIVASGNIQANTNITISNIAPQLFLVDTNNDSDFALQNTNGTFVVKDTTNSANRFTINSSGNATLSGNLNIIGDLDVDGHTELDNVNIAGVVTAQTYKGALEATSASFSSNIDANGDLDVDGHTNLDNVSIAGVTTFAGDLTISSILPKITLNDTNNESDYEIKNENGSFRIRDIDNPTDRYRINSSGGYVHEFFGTAAFNSNVTITNTAPRLDFVDTDHNSDYRITNSNGTFVFYDVTNGATRLSIASNGNISVANDLDVDGHTNLDNVSVAGVTTFASNVSVGSSIAVGTGVTVESNGQATFVGIVTAQKFVGDGSSLTGISGSGGVTVQDEGSALSTTATTLNFVGSGVVATGNGATKTITIAGGTSQNVFQTIAVAGQSNVVADSATDTLTLAAGSNVTITTNAGTDTVTIAANAGNDVGITTSLSGSFTASAGTPATINTLSGYSSNDLVVEYTIYIKNGSNFQTQKLLAMRDGTTIHSTQFAVMFSSSLLVQCDATINSGNILLRATPETGVTGSTTYKIKREVM